MKQMSEAVFSKRRKLTDDQVITARSKLRQDTNINVTDLAKTLNIHPTSLGNAIKGLTFKHLNKDYPPVLSLMKYVLKDEVVMDMRNQARTHGRQRGFIVSLTRAHKVTRAAISDAIGGLSYRHLNASCPPVPVVRKS